MKRSQDDMEKLEQLLQEHLQYEAAPVDFDRWAETHAAKLPAPKPGDSQTTLIPKSQRTRIWRQIVKSPYTHTAAVGIAMAISLAYLFSDGNGVLPQSVALADVQAAVEKQPSAETRGTRTCTFETDDGKETYVLPVFKRISNVGYSDKTFDKAGELVLQFCHHYPSETMTVIFPPQKAYCRIKMAEGLRWNVWGMDPKKMLGFLFQEGGYLKVGPKKVNGVEAIGFTVSDVEQRIFGGMAPELVKFMAPIERSKCTMWVDPKTKLPIVLDGTFEVSKCLITGFRKMHLREVNGPLQWGVEIDEKEFLPEMPEGYQPVEAPQEVLRP